MKEQRSFRFKVFLPLLAVFALLLVSFPTSNKFTYEYSKGRPWKYETLVTNFDFPILKTQSQIEEEKAEKRNITVPYYRLSDDITNENIRNAEIIDLGEMSFLRQDMVSSIKDIYDRGVMTDEGAKRSGDSDEDDLIYIQKGKRAAKYPESEVFRLSEARAKLLKDMEAVSDIPFLDSLLLDAKVYDLIVPNLLYDEKTTWLMHGGEDVDVSPTSDYVKAGRVIVSKDEVVTAEIAQMLDSYKKEYNSSFGYSRQEIFFYLGNALLALAVVLLLYFSIRFTDRSVFREFNKLLYVLIMFLLFAVSPLMVVRFGDESFLYMLPLTLYAILLSSFFKDSLSLAVYSVSLMPMLLFASSGLSLFVIFLVGGVISIFGFQQLNRGWRQFLLALVVGVFMSLTYAGFRLLDVAGGNSYLSVLYLLASSLLVIAGYPLVYLFERMYSLVSNSRLAELADTSNTLLRDLERKAPGTFQHSLQVANMADYVGRLVGANPMLLRAGALYHDIGKMYNPQCFVENESLVSGDVSRYHSGQSPQQSAQDIIRHVTEGVELAEKKHVPPVVRDFIATHHGTTKVVYFYNKYINEGGDPSSEEDFRYKGVKPQTTEQVILMLCDTVEAASRTLKQHSPEEYDAFVERIVDSKIKEGQLEEAQISFCDLGKVKEALKTYLAQVFHDRIAYPNQRNNKISKNESRKERTSASAD